MLKSMLLDYTDIDVPLIYKAQRKTGLHTDLKCQYHCEIRGSPHLN